MTTFPDEELREGAIVDGASLTADIDEEHDFVVIGTGAAGAVAAHTLASAGFSVAMLEEGPWVKTREFGEDVYGAFHRMFRDGGTQVMEGRSFIPVIQGRCVGGSTVMNSAIAWRTPEDVIDDWASRFGLGEDISMASLEPHFDALERELGVRPVPDDVLGDSSRRFIDAATRAGLEGHAIRRYERGCRGSGRCMTGCPHGAKQGMNVSYVPWALALGARLYASCRAERVEIVSGRARAVIAHAASGGSRRVTLRAREGVVVAASTIQTPNLLRRSGLRSPALGEHFQVHPGIGLGGLFDDDVDMQFGATQGAESIALRKSHRVKLETITLQPELAAVRIPGVGAELMRRFESFSQLAVWAAVVRSDGEGSIRPTWGGGDRIRFSLTPRDMVAARKGLGVLARLMFDAGAREVWPAIHGLPSVITSPDDVRRIDDASTDPRAYGFIATHLFGAARMGKDARSSVVGPDFQAHEARGLYVVDSSIFPTNLGVNPQHSIMALSRLAATRIANVSSARRGARGHGAAARA